MSLTVNFNVQILRLHLSDFFGLAIDFKSLIKLSLQIEIIALLL
jgi:hypothetical protein